ncbi:cytosine-purine permease [Heliocybe sulcata]|uniref:Cytosine-purine permease n=1 Tax=Heliocybe sulcata TaxID=5364 RepID=A0A5C3MWR4_9AGAM|nr:cytosine-purine permease [Heliocybe sulcata]
MDAYSETKEKNDVDEGVLPAEDNLEKGTYQESRTTTWAKRTGSLLRRWGVETHGISPIPPEQRTDTRLYEMFFVWFSANMGVLSFSTGSAGPAFFSLGLRDSLATLVVVDVITCAIPAYFAVFGPKLGMRAMIQGRYSWGYYGAIIPSALNVFTMQGFLVLNCIVGGQTLAAVSDNLNDTLGIVIIGIISLVVVFFGYRVLHWYESVAWIPNVIALVVMLGVGGKRLHEAPVTAATPTTAAHVLSFAGTVGSTVISWCTYSPDYGVYHSAQASSKRIFLYTYLGFFVACFSGHCLGAAFAAAASTVPAWNEGFEDGDNVGGLFYAVLAPAGGFGKFLTVLVALTVPAACAPTMYTFGTSFMTIAPFFAKIPRYLFAIVSTAITIPVAIVGATHFYETFVDIISVIGYWSAVFAAIVLVEHCVFRKGDFSLYSLDYWNQSRRLPPGIAAVLSFLGAVAILVPSMSQAWYVGPIAQAGTGDIGVETGFFVAASLYLVLRAVERKVLW